MLRHDRRPHGIGGAAGARVHIDHVGRLSEGVEFDVQPCQGIGSVAIKRTQEERVLVAESGVEAATRELRRTEKVRQRRGVIAAQSEHTHRAFDSGFRVETSGTATGSRRMTALPSKADISTRAGVVGSVPKATLTSHVGRVVALSVEPFYNPSGRSSIGS